MPMTIFRVLNSIVEKISPNARAKRLQPILDALQRGATVLDVGVWSTFPEPHASENWLEKQLPRAGTLVTVGLGDMTAFRRAYPNTLCVQADGTALPFRDGAVHVAVANAVLEHVAPAQQEMFIRELARVSADGAHLAVPDRWCPIEVHTRLPFLHWLPRWRTLFRMLGQSYWAAPESLTLFSAKSLARLLHRASPAPPWTVTRQRWMGMPMTLMAHCARQPKQDQGTCP